MKLEIAPAGRLGFTQLPTGIGWILEGYFGPSLYGQFGSKENLSRDMLMDRGIDVGNIPIGEGFSFLANELAISEQALTAQLYAANNIGAVWYIMGIVGLLSAFGMYVYGRWTYRFAMRVEAEARATA